MSPKNERGEPDTELGLKVKRLEAELAARRGFRFQPVISFDGVAIIVSVIIGAVAWGKVTTVQEQNTSDIHSLQVVTAEHTVSITELRERTRPLLKGQP